MKQRAAKSLGRTSDVSGEARAPLVSVIVPTFERRDLVVPAVKSVLGQTFTDFELIVIDDGSTDGTEEALAPYRERLRYHRQPHRGVAAARNAGLRLARGAIVAALDSDDLWFSDHLDVVTQVFERLPEAVLVSTSPSLVSQGREGVAEARLVDPLPQLFIANVVGVPTCVAIRRDALESIGGFDERLRVDSDTQAFVRLAFLGPFALLQRRTFVQRSFADSVARKGHKLGLYAESRVIAGRSLLADLERRPDVPRKRLAQVSGSVRFAEALQALNRGNGDEVRPALQAACRLLPELSTEIELVIGLIERDVPRTARPGQALAVFSEAALAWPDGRSPTAVALAERAALLALQARELGLALRFLRPLPARAVLAHARARARRAIVGRLKRIRSAV